MADAGSSDGRIDPEFTAYPLRELADTALQRATELGAQHADFRAERILAQEIVLSDGALETLDDSDVLGLAVRVVVDGTWGFAATADMTPDAAGRAAAEAVQVARVAAAINSERIELADEPRHGDVRWVSAYQVDPFQASLADKVDLLTQWSKGLLAHERIAHVDAALLQVRECKFYSDGGTTARVFGTFLTWLSEKTAPVFVVATANDISQLPPELLRKGRLDEIFFVDLPSKEERGEIFRIHVIKRGRDVTKFDVEALSNASKDFSGAEIEESINSALYDAFYARTELTTDHVLTALSQTVPLAKTMDEQINRLRSWAEGRARNGAELDRITKRAQLLESVALVVETRRSGARSRSSAVLHLCGHL